MDAMPNQEGINVMIPIYTCDDNSYERDYLNNIIKNYILIEGYPMEITFSTDDPQELIDHRSGHKERSIYFFDVDLKNDEYNGFTLAKKIRELDPRGFVVFVTTHEEMIYETFKFRVEAMSYIIKDKPEKLASQIRDCLKEIEMLADSKGNDMGGYFTVKVGDSNYQIPMLDILCFETSDAIHKIVVRTASQRLEFRGGLSSVYKELGKDFLKIHRSYVVQINKIKQVNYADQTLVLADDSVRLISRKGKKLLKEYFESADMGAALC